MNMKKTILLLSMSLILLYILPGCHKDKKNTAVTPLTGVWTASPDFEGVTRNNAVAFSIGNTAYLGTGFSGTNRLNDFWSFDGSTWTQLQNVPGVPREKAVGFCVGDTGYIGTGYDGVNLLNDFYAYDADNNNWITKPVFEGSARSNAVGFGVDTVGFIGTGFDGNYKNDLYKFSPSKYKWTKVATLTKKTSEAVSFVINSKAYICSGINNGVYVNELMEYDQVLDTCIVKTDAPLSSTIGDIRRSNAAAFTLNSQGYITCGINGLNATNNTFVYNPVTNTWGQVIEMAGGARLDAVGFSINGHGYVATGRSNNARYDDVWKFVP
jgi:N-acetylneuraminic acid mutarotase